MASIRRVPEAYPTFVDAYNAAASWDTISLGVGVHVPPNKIRKPVHIVGDDPEQTIVLNHPSQTWDVNGYWAAKACLGYELPLDTVGQLFVEGLRLAMDAATFVRGASVIFSRSGWPSGCTLTLNRVLFLSSVQGQESWVWTIAGEDDRGGIAARIRMVNCSIPISTDGYGLLRFADIAGAGSLFEVVATETYVSSPYTVTFDPDTYVFDRAPMGTAGYGVDYGGSYVPQFQGQPYRIARAERLEEGDQEDEIQVLLYRETAYQSNRLEAVRWMETTPDPVTGQWSFDYLPRTDSAGNPQRYAVVVNPPECYQPEMHRWYLPEQEE